MIKYEAFSLPKSPHFCCSTDTLIYQYQHSRNFCIWWLSFYFDLFPPCIFAEFKNSLFGNLHLLTFSDIYLILTSHDAQNAFFMHRSLNIYFKNLHLMIFDDLDLILTSHDVQNDFSVHKSSKIHFLKICSWWPLVILTLFWPPMKLKMLFLWRGAKK